MNYYEELGVSENATDEEIRAAFRRKAKQNHPDRGGSADKMVVTNRAYETLSSPQRRLGYDRTGEDRPQIDNAAQQFVMQIALEWMGSEPNSGDLIADVTARLNSEDQASYEQIRVGTQYLDRLCKRITKIKYKGKGTDFLRHLVAIKIRDTKQNIEKLKDRQKMLAQARIVLAAYDYEVEAPPSSVQRFAIDFK